MPREALGQPVRCKLTLGFDSPEDAEKVQRSVELDNEGYVESRVEGSSIVAEIETGSITSLLHTLDDYLVCASVASKIVSKER